MTRELGYCQETEIRNGEQWGKLGGVWSQWESAVNWVDCLDYLKKILGQNKNRHF